jgi:hypothetical protein
MIRRQNNNQWSGAIAPRPAPTQNFPNKKFNGKFLASIFWYQDGVLLIDYPPKGKTINAEYYSSLLLHLKEIWKEKPSGNFIKAFLFLHDNAPAHRALATQKKLA